MLATFVCSILEVEMILREYIVGQQCRNHFKVMTQNQQRQTECQESHKFNRIFLSIAGQCVKCKVGDQLVNISEMVKHIEPIEPNIAPN